MVTPLDSDWGVVVCRGFHSLIVTLYWDYTWTQDVATPMHFHDKDALVVYLEDGDMRSTTPDGKLL